MDSKYLKFKTVSKRIDGIKLRIKIEWNDSLKHELVERIKKCGLKSISELNTLVSKGIDELYIDNHRELKGDGEYSLWYSEYKFSLIITIIKDVIKIVTLKPSMVTHNVKNVIEIKSVL